MPPFRGDIIWSIVGILLIIALVIWIFALGPVR